MNFTARDPLTPIPPSRHPFQFWVLAACVFGGWVGLVEDPDTAFSREALVIVNIVWGLLLIVGGTVGLVSAWWTDRIAGLLMERVSLGAIGVGALAYGSFQFWVFGSLAGQPASLTIAVGVASLWRVRHISREIHILVRLVESRIKVERAEEGE